MFNYDDIDPECAKMPQSIYTPDGQRWYKTGYSHILTEPGSKRHNRPIGTPTYEYFHAERGDAIRLHAFTPTEYFID